MKEDISTMKSNDELNKEEGKKKRKKLRQQNCIKFWKQWKCIKFKKIHIFYHVKMFKATVKTFAKNCVHKIKVSKTDNKSVLWIKLIDIQKKLCVKSIHDLVDNDIKGNFKTKNLTDEQIKNCKKHGSKLIDGQKFVYAPEGIIIPVIMHFRTLKSYMFKRIIGFKLHDVINCKEKTVLESIKFEGENMLTKYSVLGYKNDLYYHGYKMAIEVYELCHNNRNIYYEI